MKSDFGHIAENYDRDFTFSPIGIMQRKEVYNILDKALLNKANKKLSILEINCGTGEDALYLSKLGHKVIATDVSEEMIEIASSKKRMNNLTFKTLNIKDLDTTSFHEKFDLIFSNFGGLNCLNEKQLVNLQNTSSKILNKNGKFIGVIMDRNKKASAR